MNNGFCEIKRFPYCGFSHNLVEMFLIIGYDLSFIINEMPLKIEIYEDENKETISNNNLNELTFDIDPSILSVLSSDYKKEMISFNDIMKFLFPKPFSLYYTHDPNSNVNIENYTKNLIFQINPSINDEKINSNAYCYYFHEQHIIKNFSNKNIKVFIPKCFVIISQYQCFKLFNDLCDEIYKQFFLPEIEIPLEIQIYNILNFIPMSIYSKESFIFFCYHTLSEYSLTNNHNEFLVLPNQKKYNIQQISGYPFYDIHISKIFTLLPYNQITEIFLYTFLEKQLNIFYMKTETLNLFMLVMALFNFPLDSQYDWGIYSIGLNELNKGSNSDIINKPNNNILGFNLNYNESFEIQLQSKPHFTLNLEEAIIRCFDSNIEEKKENLGDLRDYLNSILIKNNISNERSNFEKIIIVLNLKIKEIFGKLSNIDIDSDFFIIENNIKDLNRSLQNIFYDFYLNFFSFIYPIIKMNRLEKPNKKGEYFEFEVKDFDKNEFDLDEDEGNFIHNFLESFRFYSYFDYISSRKQFEMLHLIHMIFDELVVLKKLNKTIILDYMDLIDKIYINDNSKEASINFYSFYLYYKNNLQEFFGKEIESDFIEKKIDISKNRITYKYNKIDFDNSIIIKYINLLNKLKTVELEEIFPSLEIKKKPAYMMMFENEIPDLIENSCFEFKQIEFQEIITMSVLNILFLNIEKYDINIIKNEIKQLFSVITISLRKYIFRIMYIYYNLCLKQIENKNYSLLSKVNSFIEIFDHLTERNILPNYSLINLMEKIFSLYNKEEDNIKKYNSENDNYQQINEQELNTLFSLTIEQKTNIINDPITFILNMAQSIFSEKYIEEKNVSLNFKINSNEKTINTRIYSSFKLFQLSNNFYNAFVVDFSLKEININFYNEVIINLLFFFQNIKKFSEEFNVIMKILFNSLCEKLVVQ